MSGMPWVRFFPSDWLGGTRSMSAAETGIYITLVATMYEKGEPIPEDHARLARLCGASNSTFKTCLLALIDDGKIVRTDNGLWNERVQKETVYRLEKSEVGSRAAKTKWDRKRNEINDDSYAPAMPSQSDRNANQKPESDIDTNVSIVPLAAKTKTRGTRLTENWVLPKSYGDWALSQGLPRERILIEANKMRDWSINAGKNGVKKDWMAAWRNWVQGAIDALPRGSPSKAEKPRNIAEASVRLLEQMREAQNANTQSGPASSLTDQDVRRIASTNG